MKRLFFALLMIAAPAFGGWSASRSITIDHTKIGGSDLTDYVFTICANGPVSPCDNGSLVIGGLKGTGSGGLVTDAQGDDIRPYTDSTCTTPITTFQREYYLGTSGALVMKILVASVSASVDTLVGYLCYGNPAITTDGSSSTTWPTAYKAAYQVPDGTTLSAADSSQSARTLTLGSATAQVGLWDGGIFAGTNPNETTAADTGLPSGATNRTVSMWWQHPGIGFGNGALTYYGTAGTSQLQRFYFSTATTLVANGGGGDDLTYIFGLTPTQGVWYHFAYTFDGSAAEIWVNGVSVAGPSAVSWNTVLVGTLWVGATNPALANLACQCYLDDIRITNTKRVDLVAEFNNGNAPASFFAFGSENSLMGGVRRVIIL